MLKLSNISKTFNPGTVNEKKALTDVNLSLESGDFVTVLGSNGAGKSTLFNAIAGSFPVDEGTIRLDGVNITNQPDYKRSKYIGRLFQDPLKGTAPHMTIEENLALAYMRASASHSPFSMISAKERREFPVIGVVTAGMPILAVENQEGTLPWHEPGCFALRVRGDSMIGAGILSGDKVIVRPQPTADDGQIVVARLEDEATVKRLRRRNGQVWLMPENDSYEPIDGTYAEIIGIVKGVVREY